MIGGVYFNLFYYFLQVDLLNDIAHPPRILTNFSQAIQPATFKRDLDSYLKTRAPVTFLSELRSHLQVVCFLPFLFAVCFKLSCDWRWLVFRVCKKFQLLLTDNFRSNGLLQFQMLRI